MPVRHDTSVPDGIDVDRVETNLTTTASVARELAGEMTVELQSGQDDGGSPIASGTESVRSGNSFAENARSDDRILPSPRASLRRVQEPSANLCIACITARCAHLHRMRAAGIDERQTCSTGARARLRRQKLHVDAASHRALVHAGRQLNECLPNPVPAPGRHIQFFPEWTRCLFDWRLVVF